MTTKRLLLLQVVLLVSLGAVFFLPKVANSTPQGIELSLPTYVGNWLGEDQEITKKELEVLAKDTSFARKLYVDGKGHGIFASIVMSGQDLDNSIHRPERCLPAQGWSVVDSRRVNIPTQNGGALDTTRLHNVRKVPTGDGQTVSLYNLNYYWFVGYNVTTASHLRRTWLDIRDRVLYGYNQRWAYITIAANVPQAEQPSARTEEETDKMLKEFIQQLLPMIHRPGPEPVSVAKR
ncbi:MAG: exosortase C-terminal domain/associated protein EpsI [Chthoniobacterales bacterium]